MTLLYTSSSIHTRFISGSRSECLISYCPELGAMDPPLAVQPGVLKSSAYKLLHISNQMIFWMANPNQKQKPAIDMLELDEDID